MINGIAMQFRRAVVYHHSPLDPLRQRVLDRDVLCLAAVRPDTIYPPGNVLVVWVACMLSKLQFLSQAEWRLILDHTYDYLFASGETIARVVNPLYTGGKPSENLLNYQLAFTDGRYVAWTGTKDFLDLRTGDTLAQLPQPALESLSYNLTELARRELRRFLSIEKSLESKDAGQHFGGQEPL